MYVRHDAQGTSQPTAELRLTAAAGLRLGQPASQKIRPVPGLREVPPVVDDTAKQPALQRTVASDDRPDAGGQQQLQEGSTAEQATVRATASTAPSEDITIGFRLGGTATLGSDYTISPASAVAAGVTDGKLVIREGYLQADLVLAQRDDDEGNEEDETIELTFASPSVGKFAEGTPTRFTIKIIDDDLPPISFALEGDKRVLDEGVTADTVTVLARVDVAAGQDIPVEYRLSGSAIAGEDFKVSDQTLVIPKGQREGRLGLTVILNTIYDGARDIAITFPPRPGKTFRGPSTFQLRIEDNDPPEIKLEFTKSRLEERIAGDTAKLIATLPAPAMQAISLPLTLGGSATAGKDLDVSASALIIPAGADRGEIAVLTVRDDNHLEGTETVEIGVASATAVSLASGDPFRLKSWMTKLKGAPSAVVVNVVFQRADRRVRPRLEALTAEPKTRERLIGQGVVLVFPPSVASSANVRPGPGRGGLTQSKSRDRFPTSCSSSTAGHSKTCSMPAFRCWRKSRPNGSGRVSRNRSRRSCCGRKPAIPRNWPRVAHSTAPNPESRGAGIARLHARLSRGGS